MAWHSVGSRIAQWSGEHDIRCGRTSVASGSCRDCHVTLLETLDRRLPSSGRCRRRESTRPPSVAVNAVRADAPRHRQRPSCRPLLNVDVLTGLRHRKCRPQPRGSASSLLHRLRSKGGLQGHVHLESNRRTAVKDSLRQSERRETELAQTPRLLQAQFDRVTRTPSCTSVPRERMGLT
jgi:hypothetical protein